MELDCKKDFHRFIRVFSGVFLAFLVCVGAIVVILDPFYQYHSPWLGLPIVLDNAVYQTPGAARNLDYRDAIVGTSMTENFHTSWFDEEMGWNTMKLSYSGARSNDLKVILSEIFSREEPVEHIFMDINDYQLTSDSWTAYVERPGYLYDNNLLNDYNYIYNRDVLAYGWERVLDAFQGVEDNIDTAYTWEDADFGAELALNSARDVRRQLLAEQPSSKPLEEKLIVCRENLDNIIPFIEQNPDTEFIIFFPPYSMLYWEQVVLRDDLEGMLGIYRYAIEQFLQYENVQVYYFQNEQEIIADIENYRDVCHHRPEYNRYIFECVRDGRKRVTNENLDKMIQEMYEFARDFDYGIYWQ